MRRISLLAVCLFVACSPGDLSEDEVIAVGAEDAAMNAAIEEARATVGEFIEALQAQSPEDMHFAVKAPIEDGDQVEHFWLTDVTYLDGVFTGRIDNTPQWVTNVAEGDLHEIRETDISDWMYFHDGVAVGNRTLVVLFDQMPEEEVARVKQMLGWE
jgi:uncharacterized protein YegJ (DUF2314 family)